MKRTTPNFATSFVRALTSVAVSLAMICAPMAEASTLTPDRGRGGQQQSSRSSQRPSGTSQRQSGVSQRPSGSNSSSRPSSNGSRPAGNNNGSYRPSGNNGNNQNSGSRPGGAGNNNNRPETGIPGNNLNGGNQGNRPGSNQPGGNQGNRPGSNQPGGNQGNRPGNNQNGGNQGNRPGNNQPGYRPGAGVNNHPNQGPRPNMAPPRHHGPNYRHPVPFFQTFHRPAPPRGWVYHAGGPTFGTILGVALGTAFNISLNALLNSGYNITSYGDNVVYLSNVPQMNFYWPSAAMYYNNGYLSGSQFTYPCPYYDMNRFYTLYNTFVGQYGAPVQSINNGGMAQATWYGAGNRFVTLTYDYVGGQYYTTLSFGY